MEDYQRPHKRLFTLLWALERTGAVVELCPMPDYWHYRIVDATKLGHLRRLVADDGILYINWR